MGNIVVYVLTLILLIQIYTLYKQTKDWQQERKDLYDRIMSKDLREYKDAVEPIQIYKPVDHSEETEWIKEQEARKV